MTQEPNEPSGASGGSLAKPSGVAASQAAAFFVDIGMQEIVEGFEPVKLPQWEMVGKDTDGTPIYRNNWGEYRRWIPVTERLPEELEQVIVWMPDCPHHPCGMDMGSCMTDSIWGVSWMVSGGRSAFPTHWMPLPAPPTDDK